MDLLEKLALSGASSIKEPQTQSPALWSCWDCREPLLENQKINKPMWKPQQPRWTSIQAKRSKNGRSSLLKVKVQKIKRKHHLEPLSLLWKCLVEPLNFKPLRLNVELFSETFEPLCSTCISNLYVEHFNHGVEPGSETFMRKLYVKLLSGTFMTNLFPKKFMWNLDVEHREPESFCGTFLWNLYLWNLETCNSETCTFLWNRDTFKSGTCMWYLGEPELLRVEPVCGTLGNLNF